MPFKGFQLVTLSYVVNCPLMFIQNSVTISEDCAKGQDIYYELSYTADSGTLITTCVVNGTECSDGRCYHELQNSTTDSRCQPPVSQFSGEGVTVFVTARNVLGRSDPSSPVPISEFSEGSKGFHCT